jgi:hypothetical protein
MQAGDTVSTGDEGKHTHTHTRARERTHTHNTPVSVHSFDHPHRPAEEGLDLGRVLGFGRDHRALIIGGDFGLIGDQEGVPSQTPEAPSIRQAVTRPPSAAVEDAAGRDHWDVGPKRVTVALDHLSTICGMSGSVASSPVWPPPSVLIS